MTVGAVSTLGSYLSVCPGQFLSLPWSPVVGLVRAWACFYPGCTDRRLGEAVVRLMLQVIVSGPSDICHALATISVRRSLQNLSAGDAKMISPQNPAGGRHLWRRPSVRSGSEGPVPAGVVVACCPRGHVPAGVPASPRVGVCSVLDEVLVRLTWSRGGCADQRAIGRHQNRGASSGPARQRKATVRLSAGSLRSTGCAVAMPTEVSAVHGGRVCAGFTGAWPPRVGYL